MYDITPDIKEEALIQEEYEKWKKEQARPDVLSDEEAEEFFRDIPF